MQQLIEYLRSIPPGQLANVGPIDALLAEGWDKLDHAKESGMKPDKLLGRMESVSWNPPILSFTIERHGGTVLGSKRAELQDWQVNVETLVATCSTNRFRQLVPMQPKLNVKPMAAEIVSLILSRQQDNRLKWNGDGSVRVVINDILPSASAATQTLAGRRKRFREEVEHLLTTHGWRKVRSHVYAPTDD